MPWEAFEAPVEELIAAEYRPKSFLRRRAPDEIEVRLWDVEVICCSVLKHESYTCHIFKGYRPLPPTPGKKVRGRRRGKDNCEHSLCSRAAQSLGRESYEAISSGKKQKVMPKVTF